ncbi:MAG: hypothetical protein R3C18_07070 [Planctomycetaceae bacterium]
MSDPIVIELQRLASDSNCPVDELLRKALIVATKLNIDEFRDWISLELNGYPDGRDVPCYRTVPAEVRVYNDVQRRWMPMFMPSEFDKCFDAVPITQPVGTLLPLIESNANEFKVTLPSDVRSLLMQGQGEFPMEPGLFASSIYIVKALDAIRNALLDWALKLEQQGILGEGMRFTPEEKAIAVNNQNIHIGGNFQGVLGDVNESTVTQSLAMSVKAGDFSSLQQKLTEAGISKQDLEELKTALEADPKPNTSSEFGPQVSSWIGTMMGKAASGAWKVTLDTAGKLIPTAIAAYYGLGG